MPTPPKPFTVLKSEKKSHRTKAELQQRKEAEESLLTGQHMKMWPEVAADPIAAKEFKRVRGLLKKIGKDDGLHEGVVNRYAQLKAECTEFEEKRESFYKSKDELQEEYRAGKTGDTENGGMTASEYYKLLTNIQKNIISLDKQIMAKRKMMLDIEKENIMTIASALRSIPKKVEKKDKPSGIAAFMQQRNGGGG
jgi:hypothetical protein